MKEATWRLCLYKKAWWMGGLQPNGLIGLPAWVADYSYMRCSPPTLIGIVLLFGCVTMELLSFDAVFK
jgi:hypothetical protein